jgi:Flp pilus assembly pilin Flp
MDKPVLHPDRGWLSGQDTPRGFLASLRRLPRADKGVTAIEYALLGSLLSIMIIAAASMAGSDLRYTFDSVSDSIAEANNPTDNEESEDEDKDKDKKGGGGDNFPDPCNKGGTNCGGDDGRGRGKP